MRFTRKADYFPTEVKTLCPECVNGFHLSKLGKLTHLCCGLIQLHYVREYSQHLGSLKKKIKAHYPVGSSLKIQLRFIDKRLLQLKYITLI